MGLLYSIPCSGTTCTLWLEPSPSINLPFDNSSTVAAAIASVGAERTKTLLIAVPSLISDVAAAQPESIEN